jgi:hypothetical protein
VGLNVEVSVKTTGDDGSSTLARWLVTDSGDENTALLTEWWVGISVGDLKAGMPKVEEYGAHDLEIMGAILMLMVYREQVQGLLDKAKNAPIGTELACWFYVLGKVARLVSDYLATRAGKADTWHDITFYSMMARRIQATGRWP